MSGFLLGLIHFTYQQALLSLSAQSGKLSFHNKRYKRNWALEQAQHLYKVIWATRWPYPSLGLPNQHEYSEIYAGCPTIQAETAVREIECAWNILVALASGSAPPVSECSWDNTKRDTALHGKCFTVVCYIMCDSSWQSLYLQDK